MCVLDCARRARTKDAFNLQQRGLEQPWLASPGEKTRQSKARRVDLSRSFPCHCIEHDERRRRPCKEHRCSTSDQSSPARSFFFFSFSFSFSLHNPTHSLPLPAIPSACLLPGLCLALTLHSPRRRRCLHSWMLNRPPPILGIP